MADTKGMRARVRPATKDKILRYVRVRTARGTTTLREIAEATRVPSSDTVHRAILELRDEGLVAMEPRRARTIRAVGGGPVTDMRDVPFVTYDDA